DLPGNRAEGPPGLLRMRAHQHWDPAGDGARGGRAEANACSKPGRAAGESMRSTPVRKSQTRKSTTHRSTTETDIHLALTIEGRGQYEVSTGIRFFDHMLELFARH